jgi:hypothetical protein
MATPESELIWENSVLMKNEELQRSKNASETRIRQDRPH